jgi:CO/xanthine dehydrogenase Mo-binding subunit
VPRVDGRERVTGAAEFTCDVQLPGMLWAAGLRSPYPHARVVSVDTTAAAALPGVRGIFHHFNATSSTRSCSTRGISWP